MTDDAYLSETLDAMRDAYLTLCRLVDGAAGVASADEGDVAWGMTPLRVGAFNRVVRVRLDADRADARIREVVDRYAAAGVPGTWWLDPQSKPADIEARLERAGMVGEDVPGMRIEAGDVPALALPTGVTLRWADQPDEVRAAMLLVAAGFGLPDALGGPMADLVARVARPDSAVRTVVAELDGTPVASAQGVDLGGAVGIYNVAALAEARGRGIGVAVTIAVLRDAMDRGARFGVLESSDMGHGIYRRIGFRDVAPLRVYGPTES